MSGKDDNGLVSDKEESRDIDTSGSSDSFGMDRLIADVSRSLVSSSTIDGGFAQPPLIAKGCVRLFADAKFSNETPPLIYGSGDVQALTILGLKYLKKQQDDSMPNQKFDPNKHTEELTVYLGMLWDLHLWKTKKEDYIARKLASIEGVEVKKNEFFAAVNRVLSIPRSSAKNQQPQKTLLTSVPKKAGWENFIVSNKAEFDTLAKSLIEILNNEDYVTQKPSQGILPDMIIERISNPEFNKSFPSDIIPEDFSLKNIKEQSVSVTNYFLPFSRSFNEVLECIKTLADKFSEDNYLHPNKFRQKFWDYLVKGGDDTVNHKSLASAFSNRKITAIKITEGFLLLFLGCVFYSKDWDKILASKDSSIADDVLTAERILRNKGLANLDDVRKILENDPAISLKDYFKDRVDVKIKDRVDVKNREKILCDIILRMLCKWLLHTRFLTENTRLLIYDTSGMDYSAIANKYLVQCSESDKMTKIPVCTSELREIFRNLGKLDKDIIWMSGGEMTCAPWEQDDNPENMRGWAKYAMYLVFKNLAANPRDLLCIEAAAGITNYIGAKGFDNAKIDDYSKIIQFYRDTKPYQLRDKYRLLQLDIKPERTECTSEEDFNKFYEQIVNFKDDLKKITRVESEKTVLDDAVVQVKDNIRISIKDILEKSKKSKGVAESEDDSHSVSVERKKPGGTDFVG